MPAEAACTSDGKAAAAGALRAAISGVPSPLAWCGEDTPNGKGRMFALALLKGYPNTTIIIFYVLVSAISVLAMYRYHRSQM
jgi:hypothetical protein